MRIATWNINSVRLRIELVLAFLKEAKPDILCLQETKCLDDQFPAKALAKAGYKHQAVHGQKGYHGVAIISKQPFAEVSRLALGGKPDARHVAVTLADGTTIHNFYVPAGGDDPDPERNEKFAHKLQFLADMRAYFDGRQGEPHILVGDLNIAPLEHDVWSHKQLMDVVSHTPIEIAGLGAVQDAGGFVDVMRALIPAEEKLYTWWSYRAADWRASNRGRRLDHIWVTEPVRARAIARGRKALTVHEHVRDWERTSDHAPVSLHLGQ